MVLIDKESLIEHMRKAYKGNIENGFKWDLISAVAVIETVDEITPPKAHWIKGDEEKRFYYPSLLWKCSYCHTPFIALVDRYHYCPNCGASMEGIEE